MADPATSLASNSVLVLYSVTDTINLSLCYYLIIIVYFNFLIFLEMNFYMVKL